MSDERVIKRGNATTGKLWNSVSSGVGDVYQAAAKKNMFSSSGRTYRNLDRALASTPGRASSSSSAVDTAADVLSGGATRRREKDYDL